AIILLCMLASCWYFCRQAGIGTLFPAVAAVLVSPMSDEQGKQELQNQQNSTCTASFAAYILQKHSQAEEAGR
ncbi:hypothetical protein H6B10_17190, partial [Gemmiger formicilis]|uniref:hypothetical protein n=1 Tax=Gemmiger formicilis TaxID=745368 RepID=UPI00195C26DC